MRFFGEKVVLSDIFWLQMFIASDQRANVGK